MNVLFRTRIHSSPTPTSAPEYIWYPPLRTPLQPDDLFPHWYRRHTIRPISPNPPPYPTSPPHYPIPPPPYPGPSPSSSVWIALRRCARTVRRYVRSTRKDAAVLLVSWPAFGMVLDAAVVHGNGRVMKWVLGAYALFVVGWYVLPPVVRAGRRLWRGRGRGRGERP